MKAHFINSGFDDAMLISEEKKADHNSYWNEHC